MFHYFIYRWCKTNPCPQNCELCIVTSRGLTSIGMTGPLFICGLMVFMPHNCSQPFILKSLLIFTLEVVLNPLAVLVCHFRCIICVQSEGSNTPTHYFFPRIGLEKFFAAFWLLVCRCLASSSFRDLYFRQIVLYFNYSNAEYAYMYICILMHNLM